MPVSDPQAVLFYIFMLLKFLIKLVLSVVRQSSLTYIVQSN